MSVDLQFYRRTTVGPIIFTLEGSPNIASVRMQVRPFAGSAALLYDFDSADGEITIADPPTEFTLSPFIWEERAGVFAFDIFVTFEDGVIRAPIAGTLTITQNVTEPVTP